MTATPARHYRALIASVAMCLALAGCGILTTAGDDPFEKDVAALRDGNRSAPLSELTDFEWDEVHLFNEYTRRETIEKVVGHPVIGSARHEAGSLLVFEKGGQVVETLTVGGDYLRGSRTTFGSDARLTPMGGGGMRLQ